MPDDVERAVELCRRRFGRLDFLVTAAAIYEDHLFETMTDEQWHRTIAANLDSVFYACRRAVPAMKQGGAIVNLASEAAHTGGSPMHSHYGATKAGVLAFTKTIARELAPRIRVNAVSPGTSTRRWWRGGWKSRARLYRHHPDAPPRRAQATWRWPSPSSAATPPATSPTPPSM